MAVFFAIKHGKNKALKELLEAGADPNIGTVVWNDHRPFPSLKIVY